MNFLIRVDSSLDIGYGHVMRCLTIADYLRDFGHEVEFCSRDCNANLNRRIIEKGFPLNIINVKNPKDSWLGHSQQEDASEVLKLLEKKDFDWLIVDHYCIDEIWESLVKQKAKAIWVLDDLVNRPHSCNLILDTTLARDPIEYNKKDQSCKVYAGSRYAILRKPFLKLREKVFAKRESFKKVNRVLINLGGTDPLNLTLNVVKTFSDSSYGPISFDIIANQKSKNYEELKSFCELKENLHVYGYVENIEEMIYKADLCIGAAGVSAYERASLGLPSILIQVADNQKDNITQFEHNKLGECIRLNELDRLHELLKEKFLKLSDKEHYQHVFKQCFKNVSPLGIFDVISHVHKKNCYHLSEATIDDMEQVYEWQIYPNARKYARNQDPPSFKAHKSWFEASLKSTHRKMFILKVLDISLGFLRVDFNNESKVNEVSILISHGYYGMGLGKTGLGLLRDKMTGYDLHAFILPENKASIKIFEKCGYKKISENWYLNKG